MNVSKLFLIGAVALGLGLTACNKNNDEPIVKGNHNATVSLKIMQDANPGFRSLGDLSNDGVLAKGLQAESAIKKVQIWIFAGEALDAYKEGVATEYKDIKATVGSRDIFIVINGKNLSGTTIKEALEKTTETLPVNIEKGLTMTASKLTVKLKDGKNTIGYPEEKGVNDLGKDPIKVSRINARVAIVSLKVNADPKQTRFDNLSDFQVAMFNVPETANIFEPNTTSGWIYGQKWEGTYENDEKTSKMIPDFSVMKFDNPIDVKEAPFFYVNPCKEQGKMFLVLRAKAIKGGKPVIAPDLFTDKEGYTYYPVLINKEGATGEKGLPLNDGKVYRNTQYNISLNITNIGNPSINPAVKANLDIKVEVSGWKVVNQNNNF